MSRAELERLTADLRKDHTVRQQLREQLADPERTARWARGRGYEITEAELRGLQESDRELSEDELEQAAGGTDDWGTGTGTPTEGGG